MSDASPATDNAHELLRRSLERGRLGHAYLFVGDAPEVLQDAATLLAQTLLCSQPKAKSATGIGLLPCGQCSACRRLAHLGHPDVTWIRPGKKSRIISVAQIRSLIHMAEMRPTEARYKVGIVTGTDRMRVEAANAFLKTLEEPPPDSIFILLTTDVDRLLETILSRCLRLNFASGIIRVDDTVSAWLTEVAQCLTSEDPSLLQRYRMLQSLLTALGSARTEIEASLGAASPLEKFPDASAEQRERWEDELEAAVEAEYRRRRGEFLAGFHAWLRDLWIHSLGGAGDVFLPQLAESSQRLGSRIASADAQANLEHWERTQRLLLSTNAQEALVLEVGLLRLRL
ncbi:MAG TPA: hypothetical protein PLX89_11545 [Verrucomicrobiota bacterium]|nr:hypothetical protein [Verrucomicrobiota bacterium]